MQCGIMLCVISLQWVLFGYSLAFGPDQGFQFVGLTAWQTVITRRWRVIYRLLQAAASTFQRGDTLLKSLVVCAICYDDARGRLQAACERLEGARLEVTDGRKIAGRGQRCRI